MTQTLATASSGSINTQYAYDLHGNLVSVTDPNGNVTTYTFDDFGRMQRQVSPVTGTTTYAYDPNGNLTSTTDANNAATARTFDLLNRVLSAVSTRASATETVTYGYDQDVCGTGNGVGRLTAMDDPAGSTGYCYERRGLLLMDTQSGSGYNYDGDGNRSAIVYPSGLTLDYSFDLADRPMGAVVDGQPVVSSAAYLPFGPMTQLVYGNGTTKTTQYDARYRPLMNRLTGPSGTIAQYDYANDAAGNITQIHDAVSADFNRDFGYDDLNRLVTANSGASLWGSGSYTYDAMGNMTSYNLGSREETFSYVGSTPKLQWVDYDAAGNELAAYSPRNHLDHLGSIIGGQGRRVDYAYDGRGLRMHETLRQGGPQPSERSFSYSPELELLSIDESTPGPPSPGRQTETDYIRFGGAPVAQANTVFGQIEGSAETTLRFTFSDHLGTPLLQTDSGANVVWRAEYEPFGSVFAWRSGDASDLQVLRFPGQESDARSTSLWLTELSYNVFRWYQPAWGRYTQIDPLDRISSVRARRGDGPAYYTYADDNPERYTDALGLDIGGGSSFTKKDILCFSKCASFYEDEMQECHKIRTHGPAECSARYAACRLFAPKPFDDGFCTTGFKTCLRNLKEEYACALTVQQQCTRFA